MSEFTFNATARIDAVYNYSKDLIIGVNGVDALNKYSEILQKVTPKDIIIAFDYLVKDNYKMNDIKRTVSKVLNILHKVIISYPAIKSEENSFINILEKNNLILDNYLKEIKLNIRKINKENPDNELKEILINQIIELQKFENHYIIKENILFPFIEKEFSEYRCLQIMWSIHDEIRRNLKLIILCLKNEIFDLKEFNHLVGRVFFDMYAIKYREEKLIFPVISESLDLNKLNLHINQAIEIGFPYYTPNVKFHNKQNYNNLPIELIDLKTGILTVNQIISIFNHLPVDITFVDENDEVKYFSSPKERFFARSTVIIGRKIQNCHPKESVHIVNKIIDEFRNGTKNEATFWIKIKGRFLYIQYFPVRDVDNKYLGTIEVSQNISKISELKGERRLLDW